MSLMLPAMTGRRSSPTTSAAVMALLAIVASQVQAIDVIVDDSSPLITYTSPRGSWTVHTGVADSYGLYLNTDTFTDVQGAKATFKFNGTAIQYLGNRGPYHGPCRINIDGQDYGTVTSNAPADDIPILLFQKRDLSASEHTITVTVENPGYPNVCEVDRFIYTALETPPSTSGQNGGGSNNNGGGGGGETQNLGAIIGGAVGGGVALILLIVGAWLYKRRAAREHHSSTGGGASSGEKIRPNFNPTLPNVDLPAEDAVGHGVGAGAIGAGVGAGAGKPQSPFNARPMSTAMSTMSGTTGGFPPLSATSTTGFLAQQHTGGEYPTSDYAPSTTGYAPSTTGYAPSTTGAGYASTTVTGHGPMGGAGGGNPFYSPTSSPSPGPGPGQGPLSPALFYNEGQGQGQQPYRGPSPAHFQQQQMYDQQQPHSPDIVPAALPGMGRKQEYAPVAPRQDYAGASKKEVERELTPAERKRREVEEEARRRVLAEGSGGSGSGSGSGGVQQQQPQQPQPQQYQQPIQQQYQQQQPQQPLHHQQQQSHQGRQTSQDQAQDLPAPPAYEG